MQRIIVAMLTLALAVPAAANRPAAYFSPQLSKTTVRCSFIRNRNEPVISDFERDWYSGHLSAAQEPSLFQWSNDLRRRGVRVLRFTWLRSFHHPVTVRVYWTVNRRPRLIAKELSGAGGYEPGKIARRINRPLTLREVTELRTALARTRVLSLTPKLCDGGSDGAQWLLESVDRTGYRFVGRWSPERGGVRDVGLILLKLTGWRFGEIY